MDKDLTGGSLEGLMLDALASHSRVPWKGRRAGVVVHVCVCVCVRCVCVCVSERVWSCVSVCAGMSVTQCARKSCQRPYMSNIVDDFYLKKLTNNCAFSAF